MLKQSVNILVVSMILSGAPALADSGKLRNGLPPCSMDSFVDSAGGASDRIYGDEGGDLYRTISLPDGGSITFATGNGLLPPLSNFTSENRINAGITGTRDAGLTTGHGSYMPCAWGRDEFSGGSEWSMSGATGGGAASGAVGGSVLSSNQSMAMQQSVPSPLILSGTPAASTSDSGF